MKVIAISDWLRAMRSPSNRSRRMVIGMTIIAEVTKPIMPRAISSNSKLAETAQTMESST